MLAGIPGRAAATLLPLLPLLAAGAALAPPADAQASERFSLAGDRVAVHNLAGQVRVERGTGSAVVVEVTRGGADAGQLRIATARDGGVEAVRIAYPTGTVVYPALGRMSRSQVTVGRDGVYGTAARGRGEQVTVTGSGRGTEAWADVRVLVPAGRTVAVHHGVGRVEVSGVEGELRINGGATSVTTTGTRGGLDVRTGSGSVSVTEADGDVGVRTGNGGVRVAGVRGQRVTLSTGSGGVSGSGVRAAEVQMSTGSGGVRVDGVAARTVTARTGSGSVRLGLDANPENVRISTGSGGVGLTVPDGFGAQVSVRTGSGGITVDLPTTTRSSGRSRFDGTVGDGRADVTIRTGSGGVRIRPG
jgi:hypothetical protein